MQHFKYLIGEDEFSVTLEKSGDDYLIKVDGREYKVSAEAIGQNRLALLVNNRVLNVHFARNGDSTHVAVNGVSVEVIDAEQAQAHRAVGSVGGGGIITTPMPGKLIKYLVAEGDKVEEGQALVTVEAMKMENVINATKDGVVTKLNYAPGDQVTPGEALLDLEAGE